MESDLITLVARLSESLHYLGEQVNMAGSCTGGSIAEAITRIPGSSDWFEADHVTYSSRQKTLQLEVPESLFLVVGTINREAVEAMVRGVQRHSGARFVVAVNGVTGPDGGSPKKSVGTVWLTWADGERLVSERCQFNNNHDTMRRQMVATALIGLLRVGNGGNPG